MEGCTQPQCPLRDERVDARFLGDLILGALAGEDMRERLGTGSRIEIEERCSRCIQDVLGGRGPLPTVQELIRRVEAARWSWRRHRRAAGRPLGPVGSRR